MVFRAGNENAVNDRTAKHGAQQRGSKAVRQDVSRVPDYAARLRMQAREAVPHDHDRLFCGFQPWIEVNYFTLQASFYATIACPIVLVCKISSWCSNILDL